MTQGVMDRDILAFMKRNIFVWSLYDFANSIIMMVSIFYFSQWLVIDSGKPDWWYNTTLMASSILFIITAPYLSRKLDAGGSKLFGVRITTLCLCIFYFANAIVMLFFPSQALLAAILFTLSTYVYLLSFLYYTPMMNDITTPENRGWVSGLGMGANYAGQVFGILVTLPFATGAIYLFGAHGHAQTMLPALFLTILAAAPLLFLYKEAPRLKPVQVGEAKNKTLEAFKKVFSIRNLVLIMVAYFLFSDALLTFANNFAIFLEKVFMASDTTKIYLTAAILLLSGIGAVILGKVSDKKGGKRTLLFILIIWLILFPALAFSVNFLMAAIVCLIAGFFFGATFGVSRSIVSELTPREIEASSFGIFTIAERFATFIGPITWSVILAATSSHGAKSYDYAILGMGVLVLVSIFFVVKIRRVA